MVKRYITGVLVFLLIDMIWLVVVAPKLYTSQIGHLMAEKVNYPAALIFYLLYVMAVLVFVINPAVKNGSLSQAAMYGALLGLSMYATYDLTNLATLRDWPILVTVIDLVWGTFVTMTTSVVVTKLILWFKW